MDGGEGMPEWEEEELVISQIEEQVMKNSVELFDRCGDLDDLSLSENNIANVGYVEEKVIDLVGETENNVIDLDSYNTPVRCKINIGLEASITPRSNIDAGNSYYGTMGSSNVIIDLGENCTPDRGNSCRSSVVNLSTPYGEVIGTSIKVGGTGGAVEPHVGMVFGTWEEVEEFYKRYAEGVGFGVSRCQHSFNGDKTKRRCMTWKCECYGAPDMRAMRESKRRKKAEGSGDFVTPELEVRRKRKSKKCHCSAGIYASVNKEGLWELKRVNNEHVNHNPTPSKSRLVKEYRMKSLNSHVRRRIFDSSEEGVPVTQIHGVLARSREGLQKIPWTEKDVRHLVHAERRLRMSGGDAEAMMEYFEKMQRDNSNFFHAHRLDENGFLKDVVWVDARSRAAYEEFGDVVCFDTTYLTNKYAMPFANFVGVNHHGQTILLGCALISHEDIETFEWVFRQWLMCMGGKAPEGILTDQAAAIRNAIARVMPDTRHRWCLWHILMKLPQKLGNCCET